MHRIAQLCKPHPLIRNSANREFTLTLLKVIVQQHINKVYNNMIKIFTDGTKDPITGRAAAAVYIPQDRYLKYQKE